MPANPDEAASFRQLAGGVFDSVFFAEKYRRRFIDLALTSGAVALETYLRFVGRDHLDPNADFSETAYLRDNPDIEIVILDGKLLCGFEHWLRYGKAERRRVTLPSRTDTFDDPVFHGFDGAFFARKYKERFPGQDLDNGDIALSLYMSFASQKRLDPNRDFSEHDYLRQYPDVATAVEQATFSSGFAHWLSVGHAEGRRCHPALTFDGALSDKPGIVIPKASSNGQPKSKICLRHEEYDGLLAGFGNNAHRPQHKAEAGFAESDRHEDDFHHYLNTVADTRADPNAEFSESHYLAVNQDIARAVQDGRYLCGYHHWVLHGRLENRVFRPAAAGATGPALRRRPSISLTAAQKSKFQDLFQHGYYCRYFTQAGAKLPEEAFEYFLRHDLMAGVVPVDSNTFDEQFYTAYYGDVQDSLAKGLIPSGYYHYVLSGEAEGRQPIYRSGRLLKTKLGDSADPVGLSNATTIAERIKPLSMRINRKRPVVMNVFIPALDGDLMFGGYIAFMHFLCRLAEAGTALRFVIREDRYGNRAWFLRSIADRPRWVEAFRHQEIVNATQAGSCLACHPDDRCIAYSTWTMFDAASIARNLKRTRPYFFIQEYEPIFHEHNAFGFIMASAYNLPHIAIFNSAILTDYFQDHRIGVFASTPPQPHLRFENALTAFGAGTKPRAAQGAPRRLICYARPERHAARNLFEICLLSLRDAIARGVFAGAWEFIGVGSLGEDYTIDLGSGQVLRILPRMPQETYETVLRSFDVGLSLMWAPHPSVMPFELARAGVVTVTNEFGNRTSSILSQFGHNILAAKPSPEGIVAALQEAVHRSKNRAARQAASGFDWPTDWDQVFSGEFLETVLALSEREGAA